MPKGELFINGVDAFTEYGISMEQTTLSALMTPPPNKEYIENKSRSEDGKRVISDNARIDERDINLFFHITAKSKTDFLEKYLKFCNVLEKGVLELRTSYQDGVIYRLTYLSCSQFTEYRLGMAKFVLRLNEPNPRNRNL